MFRTESAGQFMRMLYDTVNNFHIARGIGLFRFAASIITYTFLLCGMEAAQFFKNDRCIIFKWHWLYQGVIYFIIVFSIMFFGANDGQEFIYFQF